MNNLIKSSFEEIRATDQMKDAAYTFLLQEAQRNRRRFYRSLATACLLLVCIGFGGWRIWETPVSYISVDVNPSVELTLNRFDRVTAAVGQNKEGILLLNTVKLKGKKYIEAVELLVQSDFMQDYLAKDPALTFTVASPKASELLYTLENSAVSAQYQGICIQSDMEAAHTAHQCGMSLGKYQVYLYLSQYDDSITMEDCENMTMHQLHSLLSQYEDCENTEILENSPAPDVPPSDSSSSSGENSRVEEEGEGEDNSPPVEIDDNTGGCHGGRSHHHGC